MTNTMSKAERCVEIRVRKGCSDSFLLKMSLSWIQNELCKGYRENATDKAIMQIALKKVIATAVLAIPTEQEKR